MRNFHCHRCGLQIFFDSITCVNCSAMLGVLPLQDAMGSFEQADANGGNLWRNLADSAGGGTASLFKKCANYETHGVCNCVLDADDLQDLCASCRLTSVIPSLTNEQNRDYWGRLEAAKRWLLYSLQSMKLDPYAMQQDGQPEMRFQFMESGLADGDVMTGHQNGVITINIAEADPVEREKHKEDMREPYRTLLGHFRHESGHFYFDKLIADSPYLDEYRTLFGDERADYGESLKRYYEEGRHNLKDEHFISAYASSHPWEDWAETWAHYLHVVDTLETAYACGMNLKPRHLEEPKLNCALSTLTAASFDRIARDWLALSYVLNNLNRSMGMPDAYPFTLSDTVLGKLAFVHRVVLARKSAIAGAAPVAAQGTAPIPAQNVEQSPVQAAVQSPA